MGSKTNSPTRGTGYFGALPSGETPPSATPVRELIETLANEDVERGIIIEVLNSRGATWRSPTPGGAQEHALEEQYRGYRVQSATAGLGPLRCCAGSRRIRPAGVP